MLGRYTSLACRSSSSFTDRYLPHPALGSGRSTSGLSVYEGDEFRRHLEALVLAVLADGPAHGYWVTAQFRERSGEPFDLPEGTLYPALL